MTRELYTHCERRFSELANELAAMCDRVLAVGDTGFDSDNARITAAHLRQISERLSRVSADSAELAGTLSALAHLDAATPPPRKKRKAAQRGR